MLTNIKEINTSEISEQPIRRIYIKKKRSKENEDFSKYNTNIQIYTSKDIWQLN